MKLDFPKDFLWGGATAAEQAEGKGKTGKGRTKWDLHYEWRKKDFFDMVGPDVTSDFANRYKEDIKMWRDVAGVNSVRLGFSWARLFPDGKTLNKKAVKYYHDVLDELAKNSIKAIMTLFHFDMPEWALLRGGWTSREVVNKFEKYAEFIFDEYSNKVLMFGTFNEPIVPILHSYFGERQHFPATFDIQMGFDFGNMMILAHAKAVNAHNSKSRNSKIGVVINVAPTYPRNQNDPDDVKAAKEMHLLHNGWMLDPMLKGEFKPEMITLFAKMGADEFKLTKDDLAEIASLKVDFVGTNFYAPSRVKKYEGEKIEHAFDVIGVRWSDPNARMNVFRGWEIYPKALYDTAKLIEKEYDNLPFYVSENGMGVEGEEKFRDKNTGEINDNYRIAFVQEHLHELHKAIAEGANCFGYHMWAIFDCWSWINAYKNRYGYFEVDIKTLERRPKASAHWHKKVASANGFDDQYTKVDDLIQTK